MAANAINVNSLTYEGKEAQEIFSKSLYKLALYSMGITYMDNVKGKTKLTNGEIDKSIWQKYACKFEGTEAATLAEQFIETEAIKVNLEECYDKFWNTWMVEQTKIALDGGVPQTFSDWFFAKLIEKMEKEYIEMFWQGDKDGGKSNYLDIVNGVEKQLTTNVITGSAITSSNVMSQLEAVVAKGIEVASADDVDMSDYKVFMSPKALRLLKVALGNKTDVNLTNRYFDNYAKLPNGNIEVMGFEIIETAVAKDTIVFGPAKNLVLGYDTADSHITYKLIDMRETTGDNAFRIIAISNIAVGVIFEDLFVKSAPEE
nr:MAG: major capsid protein, P2 family protein [Bacteriophage sp.]